MGNFIMNQLVKRMSKLNMPIGGSNLLIMGFTFKENCSDIRNTRVIDIINSASEYGINVTVFDPNASPEQVKHEYDIDIMCSVPSAISFQSIFSLSLIHSSVNFPLRIGIQLLQQIPWLRS